MARDMSQRVTLARVDNGDRQGKVFAARRLIYEKNFLVTSSAVEAILRDESWVPTSVSLVCLAFCEAPLIVCKECIF